MVETEEKELEKFHIGDWVVCTAKPVTEQLQQGTQYVVVNVELDSVARCSCGRNIYSDKHLSDCKYFENHPHRLELETMDGSEVKWSHNGKFFSLEKTRKEIETL